MHHIANVIYQMFSWPGGNVVGNLLASLLWGLPAVLHLKRHITKAASGANCPPPTPADSPGSLEPTELITHHSTHTAWFS